MGDSCAGDFQCQVGLKCLNGLCTSRIGWPGEQCESFFNCQNLIECINSGNILFDNSFRYVLNIIIYLECTASIEKQDSTVTFTLPMPCAMYVII